MSRPWWWWLWDKDGELEEYKSTIEEIKTVLSSSAADYMKVQYIKQLLQDEN